MWSSLTNTKKDNWLHLMSKILGGPCLLSGRLSFSLLKSKAKKCLRKTCKEYEKKSICPSLVGQWAWVWSWETPRACRTPYIPLLMSPCRQALSPSGTRLTSSLTAAACLHNPNQEVLENKNFLYTSGIMRGHWTEQKLQYEEKQINCLKKDIYINTQLFILPSLSIGPVEITPWPSCSRKPCPAHFGDNGANVWGGGGVKHAGVTVYPIATPETRRPGKADIPSSKAALPGYKNTASLDMCPIPEEEGKNSNGAHIKEILISSFGWDLLITCFWSLPTGTCWFICVLAA